MLESFLKMASDVSMLLKAQGASQKSLDEHRRCQDSLCYYLDRNQIPFTNQTIIPWLEEAKLSKCHDTYNRYRHAAYRLLRFMNTGTIEYEEGMFGYYGYQYHDCGRPSLLPARDWLYA